MPECGTCLFKSPRVLFVSVILAPCWAVFVNLKALIQYASSELGKETDISQKIVWRVCFLYYENSLWSLGLLCALCCALGCGDCMESLILVLILAMRLVVHCEWNHRAHWKSIIQCLHCVLWDSLYNCLLLWLWWTAKLWKLPTQLNHRNKAIVKNRRHLPKRDYKTRTEKVRRFFLFTGEYLGKISTAELFTYRGLHREYALNCIISRVNGKDM